MTLEPKRRLGYAGLGVMGGRLKGHDFFLGDRYSIAGIALHAYTQVAHESGFDLGR
jgi:glutathione S-transferase